MKIKRLDRRKINRLTSLILFAVSFLVASWLLPQASMRPGGFPGKFKITERSEPGPETFFVSRGQHELSHLALYHGIGPSVENARKADILIIGNSRGQLGFDEKVWVESAAAIGLRIFNLSVGHADSAKFALSIIRKYDLQPKVIIANGGDFLYYGDYSKWAKQVVTMSAWEARKHYFEYSLAWALERRLHRYLPYLDYFERSRYGWIHYRSTQTGWWRNANWPEARYPVTVGTERRHYQRATVAASRLYSELQEQDSLMVMTIVPYYKVQTGHLPLLSETLGIPYVLPSFDGIETADGSHLTPKSATRISKAMWSEFIALPKVRARLALSGN